MRSLAFESHRDQPAGHFVLRDSLRHGSHIFYLPWTPSRTIAYILRFLKGRSRVVGAVLALSGCTASMRMPRSHSRAVAVACLLLVAAARELAQTPPAAADNTASDNTGNFEPLPTEFAPASPSPGPSSSATKFGLAPGIGAPAGEKRLQMPSSICFLPGPAR